MDDIFLIVLNVICAIILIAYVIHGSIKRKRIKAAKAAEAINSSQEKNIEKKD